MVMAHSPRDLAVAAAAQGSDTHGRRAVSRMVAARELKIVSEFLV
jgi:hypothetical protein